MSGLVEQWRQGPVRTGSVILTVFGDAVAPRGGEIAMADLLMLMAALGTSDGVVRTAVSRLLAEGWLTRARTGRHSFYRLAPSHAAAFAAAIPRIYGPPSADPSRTLRLAFPSPNQTLPAGYAPLAPGVFAAPADAEPVFPSVLAEGDVAALAARAWRLDEVAGRYGAFMTLAALAPAQPMPLEAMAARTILIHEYRRAALRDPRLPAALCPLDWPGPAAWALCARLYRALAPASEAWLGTATNRAGPLVLNPRSATPFSYPASSHTPAAT